MSPAITPTPKAGWQIPSLRQKRVNLRHEVNMNKARENSRLSTCPRLQVGVVAVKDGHVIAEGYNGQPTGRPHCGRPGAEYCGPKGCTAVHAEANIVAMAARYGIRLEGATVYTTHHACTRCRALLHNAGISDIVEDKPYTTAADLRESQQRSDA